MTSLLTPAAVAPSAQEILSLPQDSQTAAAARALIAKFTPIVTSERREYARYPFPMLMYLTPVDEHTHEPVGSTMVVVGKNLSEKGVGVFHQQALPYRRAIVELEEKEDCSTQFLIDLAWCRYTRFGWYESGARLVSVLSGTPGSPTSKYRVARPEDEN